MIDTRIVGNAMQLRLLNRRMAEEVINLPIDRMMNNCRLNEILHHLNLPRVL